MSNFINRRSAVAGIVAAATVPLCLASTHSVASTPTEAAADAAALKVLDEAARNLLQLFPESATAPC